MATPHVAGLGAYLLTREGPRTPAALCARMVSLGRNFTAAVPGTLRIAYNNNGA